MADVVFKLDADQGKAVRAFLKVVDAQKKVEKGFRNAGKEGQKADKTMQKIGSSARDIAAGFGIGFGLQGALSGIVAQVEKWRAHMDEIARKASQAGRDMTAFALMQERGTKGGRVQEAARVGAAGGLTPGEAWSAVQSFQAGSRAPTAAGRYQQGLGALGAQISLTRTGVPADAAKTAIQAGMARGWTPGQAARGIYAAGEASQYDPAQLAPQAFRALSTWGGVTGGGDLGYAAMATLSEAAPAEELGMLTARAGQALTRGKIWGQFGIREPGKDPFAQLEALRSKAGGKVTGQQLTRWGFGELRERRALMELANRIPALRGRMGDIAAARGREGMLGAIRGETEAEVPWMGRARAGEELKAQIEAFKMVGPGSTEAQDYESIQLRRARVLQERGLGFLVPESGKVGWYEQIQADFYTHFGQRKMIRRDREEQAAELEWIRTGGLSRKTLESLEERSERLRKQKSTEEILADIPMREQTSDKTLEILKEIRDAVKAVQTNTHETKTPARNRKGDE